EGPRALAPAARQPGRTRPDRGARVAQRRVRADPRQDHAEHDRGRAGLSQHLQEVHLARAAARPPRQRRQGPDLEPRGGGRGPQVPEPAEGRPRIVTDIHAAETILMLAPETNGRVAVKAWQALGKHTGRDHTHLALHREDEKIRFRDLVAQPRKIISSPTWSGIESERVSY